MSLEWIKRSENEGKKGPDDGTILLDIELVGIVQIVMEEKNSQVNIEHIFAVTTVIYDKFIDTAYFSSKDDASEHLEAVKNLIKYLLSSSE